MAKVSNLTIGFQTGSDGTLYATWSFTPPAQPAAPSGGGGGGGGGGGAGNIKAGSVVTVKQGARWYNGVGIAPFVFGREWIVFERIGNRVVINRDTAGQFAIMSPIDVNNLNFVR